SEVVGSPAPATPPSADAPEVVAEVCFEPDGYMNFRITSPSLSERITIDPVRLQEWKNMYGDSVEIRSVVEAIRAVNERATATTIITHALCKRQQAYLRTDNPACLRPLSQAELARELGYHRSVISRVVRGSALHTPHRRVALSELTPRLQQVMRLLLQAHPEWSNAQVASFLLYQHGLNISVRALAYHRRRILQEAADAGTT
ncbi:MAG: hypothetical protein NZ749_14360, partial [bacterium]|nr:hypothetical protein [bacterium]